MGMRHRGAGRLKEGRLNKWEVTRGSLIDLQGLITEGGGRGG